MTMTRSLRQTLAARSALLGALLCLAFGAICVVVLRSLLLQQLDETLLQLARLEATAGASETSEAFAFHEGVLLAERRSSANPLTRYAQVWTADGRAVARSRNLTTDLPLDRVAMEAAQNGELRFATARHEAQSLRSIVFPLALVSPTHSVHVLQVAAPLAPLHDTVVRFAVLAALLVVLASVGVYGIGWRVATLATRPLLVIIGQAERLEAGDLATRIATTADTVELQRLAAVLNGMLARLGRAFQSQRQFTDDASHELRAPLTALRSEIEVALKRERSAPELRSALERCLHDVLRLGRVAGDLLTLARADGEPPIGALEPVDLNSLVEHVALKAHARAAARGQTICSEGASIVVMGETLMIERALGNLVENALRHSPYGSVLMLRIGRDATLGWIEVVDQGTGVPDTHIPKLFTRFFRGDAARSALGGTGLGLAIARAEMSRLHGTVTFEGNRPGAVFRLALPLGPAGARNCDAD